MARRSLALAHQMRIESERAGREAARSGAPLAGPVYDQMRAALWSDRRTLKDIKSIKAKIEAKRGMLPKYAEYVAGQLAGNSGAQDEIVMTVLLWSFDIGDLDQALRLSAYAMRHGLNTPDRFERDTPAVIAEQTAEEVLRLIDARVDIADAAAEPTPATLADWTETALHLTSDADMHDQIRAKLLKARGYALRLAGRPADALAALRDALDLHEGCGVKKDIERLERAVRAPQGQATAAAQASA